MNTNDLCPKCVRASALLLGVFVALAACRSSPERRYEERYEEDRHPLPLPFIDELASSPDRLTDALITLEGTGSMAQTFVAPSSELVDAAIVGTVGAAGEQRPPLYVEVRSTDLTRRFGHGRVPAESASESESAWLNVMWTEQPALEPGQQYSLVVFTDPRMQTWFLGASMMDSYPEGRLFRGLRLEDDAGEQPADLAMRLTFASGEVVEAGVDDPGRVASGVFRTEGPGNRFELHDDPRGPYDANGQRAYLPRCVGDRCVDLARDLWADDAKRAELAAAAFEPDGDVRLALKDPRSAAGISCSDACRSHDFASCRSTTARVEPPQGDHSWYRRQSCSIPVVAAGHATRVGCLCSTDPRDVQTALTGEQAISEMVTSNFRRLRDGSIEQKQGALPFGVTCAQVATILGADCAGERCDELVTPWSATCKTTDEPDKLERRAANRTSLVAADYFVVPRDDSYFVVAPDGSARRIESITADPKKQLETAGPFLIQKPSAGSDTPSIAVDLRDLTSHSLAPRGTWCRYAFDANRLIRTCRKDQVNTIEVVVPAAGTVVAMPPSDRYLRPVSFDDEVFVGVDQWEYRYRWEVGSAAPTKLDRPPLHRTGFSYRVKKRLTEYHQRHPDSPQFIGSRFFGAWDGHVWAFDPTTKRAVAWQAESWPRGGNLRFELTIEDGLIRRDDYVFDPATDTFRYADIAAVAWDGRRALSDNCPPDMETIDVKAPLDDLCIVTVDPATAPHGLVLSPVPAKAKY